MWNIERYAAAWEFATLRHLDQTYGGREPGQRIPYINHLASVAAEVLWGLDADDDLDLALSCALLHDVIEDTPTRFEEVRERFGAAVAEGVLALSKDATLPSRTAQMEDSLRRIRCQPREIWAVKLADRISNLYHPPFYWGPERIEAYKAESELILAALGDAHPRLAARLAEKLAAYGSST